MYSIILTIHIVVAIVMIGLILIQHGKGADAGASFGAGASGTVFGASGSANFLTRSTAVLTAIFFVTSITLAVFAKQQAIDNHTLDVSGLPTTTAPAHTAPTK
ncbi:preprotein translocase subunit SecG [Moraxella macacae 0408225]|uniref:Protein-export membrane protein SecG n=1 Tax=Moraxella macacae 0408225 TaxID=1230338 RepID=L2F8R8_9GAMM|nr:preprotein translocase subunit SecG [Moraxella macacae]ELA08868.1 preprotein translocase subunit SecG [Moraxella macacae 0408225]